MGLDYDPAVDALLAVERDVVLTIAVSKGGGTVDKTGVIVSVLVSPDGIPIMVTLRDERGGLRGWNWGYVVGVRPAEVKHPGLAAGPPATVTVTHPGLQ